MADDPPLEIDPYAVLGVETSATTAEVKSAYKKIALRHHPDKVPHHERDSAHSKFQGIAFAYAILSDDRRRKRYDATGNTAETLDIDDDDFDWLDFFRAQWAETVTSEKINDFAGKYKGSDEERQDVLKAYHRFKGDLNKIFKEVMLSNVLDDEDRFRSIIDAEIKAGNVDGYDAYINESAKKKQARRKQAERDAREAQKHAEDLGLNGHKKVAKKQGAGREDDLAAMIQQRQKGRAANFLDDLEAKYAVPKTKNKKKRPSEEPPEEAFNKMGARSKKQKKSIIEENDEEEDDDDIDLNANEFDDANEEDEMLDEDTDEAATKNPSTKKKSSKTTTKKKTSSTKSKVRAPRK